MSPYKRKAKTTETKKQGNREIERQPNTHGAERVRNRQRDGETQAYRNRDTHIDKRRKKKDNRRKKQRQRQRNSDTQRHTETETHIQTHREGMTDKETEK